MLQLIPRRGGVGIALGPSRERADAARGARGATRVLRRAGGTDCAVNCKRHVQNAVARTTRYVWLYLFMYDMYDYTVQEFDVCGCMGRLHSPSDDGMYSKNISAAAKVSGGDGMRSAMSQGDCVLLACAE